MRFAVTLITALSVSACSTFQADTGTIRLGEAARQAREAEGWERRTYIYPAADLLRSGLPAKLIEVRQSDAPVSLLKQCDPNTPLDLGPRAAPAVLVPLVMALFNVITGQIERTIKAREKRRLASLSDQFTTSVALESFPLAVSSPVSCIVIDDVETRSDRETGEILELRPRALYVLQLRRIGRAFVIEPFAARIEDSQIIRGDMAKSLNVDLSLAMTTVTKSNTQMPGIYGYPAYNVHVENVPLKESRGLNASGLRSIVLPLPQDSESPTSLVAAITESHVTLSKEQERVALQQETRKALWEAAAEMLKTKLGD